MKDDYLWDKSGTPDPEIEQLEQLLGNLRYRRPAHKLPLPKQVPVVNQRRRFAPALAIAAAVAFMLVAAGVWFTLGTGTQKEAAGVAAVNFEVGSAVDWLNPDSFIIAGGAKEAPITPEHIVVNAPQRSGVSLRAATLSRRAASENQLAKKSNRLEVSNEEGVAARDQLIKALHLASSKLNQVQKKVQDNKTLGPNS